MGTPVTNFGKVTVSTGYTSGATSIVLSSGHGSRLPSTFSYPLSWWNATDYADPADDPDREIVTVTARTTDTLTVTRGAEGTAASAKNITGKTYKMSLGITKAMWDKIFTNSLSQSFRGLSLSAHPDNDKAVSQVFLNHADAIVMQDGQEIQDWDDLSANLATSGAGGLDTGTEQNSAIYEIYAIYNGTTKNLLLHRAKFYFLDQDVTAGEDGAVALRDATARTRIAQGFKTTNAGICEFVDVKILKAAGPTSNFWFTIEATSGGVPSGTPLATSDKYDVNRLTTTATMVRIPFRSPASLSAATQYHLVAYGDFTISATNFMSWRADTTAAAYANGNKATWDGATWTNDTSADFTCKIYITLSNSAVTMPSGYTQRALIGYCINDSGGSIKHFVQRDRHVFCGYDPDWQVGAISSTNISLIDLSLFLPPAPVMVDWLNYNGTAALFSIGTLKATDMLSTATDQRIGITRVQSSTAWVVPALAVAVEYQAATFQTSAGTANLYISSFRW